MNVIVFSQLLMFAMAITVTGMLLLFQTYWNRMLAMFALAQLLLGIIVITAISDGDISQLSLLYYGIPLVFFTFNGLLWMRDYEPKTRKEAIDETPEMEPEHIEPKPIEKEVAEAVLQPVTDDSVSALESEALPVDVWSEQDDAVAIEDAPINEDRDAIESAISEMDFISYTNYDESEDYDNYDMPDTTTEHIESPLPENAESSDGNLSVAESDSLNAVPLSEEPDPLDALTAMANDALNLSGIDENGLPTDAISPNENLFELERTLNDLLDSVDKEEPKT